MQPYRSQPLGPVLAVCWVPVTAAHLNVLALQRCGDRPARLRAGRDSVATRVWTGLALYVLLVAGEMRFLTQTGLAVAAWCAFVPLTLKCETPVLGPWPGLCHGSPLEVLLMLLMSVWRQRQGMRAPRHLRW